MAFQLKWQKRQLFKIITTHVRSNVFFKFFYSFRFLISLQFSLASLLLSRYFELVLLGCFSLRIGENIAS